MILLNYYKRILRTAGGMEDSFVITSPSIFLFIDGLQYILEEKCGYRTAEDGGQDVNPKPAPHRIGESGSAPPGQIGYDARSEVTGGVESGR